ncbi:unnamed protein product [Toxocara canis]|uniref:BHLH domain-containing protein n=1 Tax=Toxocara canis TaxID=6265 RepID=A0A183UM93_TOXCA|nr:unnamed protein product [Toxocara canis]
MIVLTSFGTPGGQPDGDPSVCRRPGSTPSTSVRRATAPVSLSREESAELEALAQLLPPHNRHLNNDPCLILQAAAQYIDQLRTTIAARVRNRTLPAGSIVLNNNTEEQSAPDNRPFTLSAASGSAHLVECK